MMILESRTLHELTFLCTLFHNDVNYFLYLKYTLDFAIHDQIIVINSIARKSEEMYIRGKQHEE